MRSHVALTAALGLLLGMGALSPVPSQRTADREAREAARSAAPTPDKSAAPRPGDTADRRASWAPTKRTRSGGYLKRDGWSVAQDRRNARKARNVARNRAAHRG
jgi:hypothetical protein